MLPNPQKTADLVIFTEEIFNGKFYFLCSVSWSSKKVHFFVTFILPEEFFKHFCFISMYSVLNKLSQYVYIFTYQKTILHALLLLGFKIVESLRCVFKEFQKLSELSS